MYTCNIIPNSNINYKPLETPLVLKDGHYISNDIFACPNSGNKEMNKIIFTKSIQVMTDQLFAAIKMNYPVYIEGPYGCGKSIVIKYLASIFNVEVLHIPISGSTTVENIYGQNELTQNAKGASFDFKPTALVEKIIQLQEKPVWIVFEGLEQASDALRDSLIQLFDSNLKSILLPNGENKPKYDYMIFGLASKPLNNDILLSKTIQLRKEDYSKEEFETICREIAKRNKSDNPSVLEFPNELYEIKKWAKENQVQIPITVRTFSNFMKLYVKTPHHIELLKQQILNSYVDDCPALKEFIKPIKTKLSIEAGYLKIDDKLVGSYIPDPSIQSLIQCMTESQRNAFAVLDVVSSKYIPIILKGPTASGKTHSVQMFANTFNKKLTVVQFNADMNDSIVFGGYQPLSQLRPAQQEEIKNDLNQIGNPVKSITISNWSPSSLDLITQKLREYKASVNETKSEQIENLINKINNNCQFYNLIDRYDSVIVKAMKDGNWLLLDSIEAAPIFIMDLIISLLSSKPKLNLYEHGSNNVIKAHPNFRLFMTYNPYEISQRRKISQSVLNRCFICPLQLIDQDFLNSFNVLNGYLAPLQNTGFDDLSIPLARITNVHLSQKESEYIDTSIVDGRTLIKLSKALIHSCPLNKDKIINQVSKIYSPGIEDQTEHIDEIRFQYSKDVSEEQMSIIKTNKMKKSTELEYFKQSLIEFQKNFSLDLRIILSQFNRIKFDDYPIIKPMMLQIFNNPRLYENPKAYDYFNLALKFMNNVTEILKHTRNMGQNSVFDATNEFPKILRFKNKTNSLLHILELEDFDVNESAIILNLYGQINSTNSVDEALYFMLQYPRLDHNSFLKGSFLEMAAKYIVKIRENKINIIVSNELWSSYKNENDLVFVFEGTKESNDNLSIKLKSIKSDITYPVIVENDILNKLLQI